VLDEAAATDKEATDKRDVEEAATKRATEEDAVKRAAEERVAEEAAVKKVVEERATEEAAVKAAVAEAAGSAGGSPAPGQAPLGAGAKRAAAPIGSTPPVKRPYMGVWKSRFVQLFLPPFFVWLHSLITLFAQVLPLRRGHRDGHGYRRCGCRGGSRAGSCQRAPDPRRSP
jgi:hypothetical protein